MLIFKKKLINNRKNLSARSRNKLKKMLMYFLQIKSFKGLSLKKDNVEK